MSFERGLELAGMLYSGATITSAVIRNRFGVSKATAKRDMTAIEAVLPVTATKVGNGTAFVVQKHEGQP